MLREVWKLVFTKLHSDKFYCLILASDLQWIRNRSFNYNSITIYGAVMTYNQWTWSWVNGSNVTVSGYPNTYSNYDSNLLYGPPPSFPFSSSDYQQLSWTSD